MSNPLPPTIIAPRLEELRRKLLDLTRRNRLLNFKLARRASVRIVDELPVEVLRTLVTDGKAMHFLSREEAPPEARAAVAIDDVPEEADPADPFLPVPVAAPEYGALTVWSEPVVPLGSLPTGRVADRHRDNFLQTALEGERLQARLTHLSRESRSALEEQGCNTLYVALGMVQWQEAGAKAVTCGAPLVFVPVELRRKNVQSRYSIASFDDDIIVNPCLAELCRRQFAVELPQFDVDGEADLDEYFARVAALIERDLKGWSFAPEIHLGLFSFAKLLMYKDLEPASWPADRSIGAHPLVQRLCGLPVKLPEEAARMPDPSTFDAVVAPSECFEVVDADSSQSAAILAAKQGKTLVIEGPPGTGKSQTITNIIAECLAAGRTVLFVAEKAAALEVVKRRLDRVGLGDFVLDMHSRFSKRRAVLDELRRALAGNEQADTHGAATADELARLRERLNRYVRELHAPVGAMAVSSYGAVARAMTAASAPEAACEVAEPLGWTRNELDEALDKVEQLGRALSRAGDRATHPWRGARLTVVGVEVRQRIAARQAQLLEALRAHESSAARLAEALRVSPPPSLEATSQLVALATWLAGCPPVATAVLEDERWDRLAGDVLTWAEVGLERQQRRAVWSRWFRDEAEDEFWGDVLERRRSQADSIFRYLQPSWYSDSRRIARSLVGDADPSIVEQLQGLKALVESLRLRAQIESELPRYRDLIGSCWEGVNASWEALREKVRTVREAHRLAREGTLPWPLAKSFIPSGDRARLDATRAACQASLELVRTRLAEWCTALNTTPADWLAADAERVPLTEIVARLEPLAGAIERLEDWCAAFAAIEDTKEPRLASFATWCLSTNGALHTSAFRQALERQFWSIYADQALSGQETLRSFRGEDHHALIERFRKADVEWIRASRRRLVQRMRQRQPDLDRDTHRESRLGQLKAQMKLKRGGVSLRKLFESTGDVVQAIKPCFMMSPISVAQYLAPGAMQFDVVIFDEASQVEPADAFGAIARGRQLLLIGDDKQLPPTNFFGRSEGEASTESVEVAAADQESILDVGRTTLPESSVCSLRWHYRSLHQSLITFSNTSFYDGKLRVFPSPHADRTELGLVMRFVPDGVYLRGEGQFNPIEARAVVAAVIEHARRTPDVSLGVGAFSTAQQRAIEDELERVRRKVPDEALEKFFNPANAEPFFVKNLETIQGDERDVVLLSIGYGRDREGKLMMNFGPLNREGGWRRLNVLVTRARRRCEVFSSIRHDEIRVSSDASRGVASLKEYLRVAEQGAADAQHSGEVASGVPRIEIGIATALEQRGYTVHVHVGAAGFHVDIAVVDPDRPGRYLLGIECDGDTYTGAATARDRDRLRMEVLVGLGWSVAHIWTTDWFRRPALMIDQLAKTIEELRAAPRRDSEPRVLTVEAEIAAALPDAVVPLLPPSDFDDEDVEQVTLNGSSSDGLAPYSSPEDRQLGTLETLLAQSDVRLIELIGEVVAAEAPVHEEQVVKVIAGWFGTKAAARARLKIRKAVAIGAAAGRYEIRDQFLWRPNEPVPPVRFRGGDCAVTRPDHIAVEEFAQAALLVLAREFGLPRASMVQATLRLLGFRRAGTKLVQATEQAIDWLVLNEMVQREADGVLAARKGVVSDAAR